MISQQLKKNISHFEVSAFKRLQEDTSIEVSLKILARFRVTLIESFDQISSGLESARVEPIWKACHKIAGNAELLGFVRFGHESRSLSKSLQTVTDIDPYIDDIKKYLTKIDEMRAAIEVSFPEHKNYL